METKETAKSIIDAILSLSSNQVTSMHAKAKHLFKTPLDLAYHFLASTKVLSNTPSPKS